MIEALKWSSGTFADRTDVGRETGTVPASDISASASQLLVSGRSAASWAKKLIGLTPESVIGKDDRKKISDPDKYPWRMIASLTIYPNDGLGALVGTGWFVHPKVLLTAGHCVFDKSELGGEARKIVVRAGRGMGAEPFGAVQAERFAMLDRWRENADQDCDVGCIYLSQPLGEQTGVFDVKPPSDGDLKNRLVNISGYPVDLDGGREQYFHANRVQVATERSIFYDVDTYGGQSGSPVFLMDDPSARPIAIGIHAYGTTRLPPTPGLLANSGPRMTPDLIKTIQEWIDKA